MFNFKEIKKVIAAAVVSSAIAVYASPSFAEELDCSSKTGYEKMLCEEQKAINEKASKATDKINETKKKADEKAAKTKEKADKKAKKAQAKAQKAAETFSEGYLKKTDSTEYEKAAKQYGITVQDNYSEKVSNVTDELAAKYHDENDNMFEARQKVLNKAKDYYSKQLSNALVQGDEQAAKKAQMVLMQLNAEEAKNNADAKNAKAAQKAQDKADKAQEKADKKAQKEAEKAKKKVVKEAEKAEKRANKDKEKADKEVKKLQKKCKKDPANCDMDKLQAALAKQEAATAAAADAKKQREDIDGTTERNAAQAALMEAAEGESGNVAASAEIADADGMAEVASAPKRCEGANGIFEIIACKAITTLADLRTILYIIAGFGLIAFAWSAIFNKISWKHFAQICIALFLLSMMGTFIGYFGYDSSYRALKFGQYLEDGHQIIDGSGNFIDGNASGDVDIPDATETEKAAKKWSLSDLKSSIKSGISAVKKAHSMYQTAKSTVENVVSNAKTIGNAIKNGEGGLDGILNTMTTVANATGNIMNSGQLLANNIAANVGGIAEDITQAGLSAEQRELRAKNQKRLAELEDQCSTGKCNESQKKELASLQKAAQEGAASKKTGVQKWLDNDGKGGGATIMAGINKVGNITNNVTNSVTKTANAAQNGMAMGNNIGGGVLGNILGATMGAATGIGEGVGMVGNENFNFKSEAKKREEKAAADKAAYESSSEYVAKQEKTADGQLKETLGDGSIRITNQKGTVTTIGTDGTITSKTKDGSVVVQDKDGNRVTTNSNGTVVKSYVDEDGNRKNVNISDIPDDQLTPEQTGKAYRDTSGQKQKYSGDASIADLAKKSSSGSAGNSSTKPEKEPKSETKEETKPKEEEKPAAQEETKPKADEKKEDLAERIKVACQKYKTERYRNACMSCVNSKSENDFVDCHAAAVKKVQQQDAINKANQKATADADKEYCNRADVKKYLNEACFNEDGCDKATCSKCGYTCGRTDLWPK